jgi:hypothetical protein
MAVLGEWFIVRDLANRVSVGCECCSHVHPVPLGELTSSSSRRCLLPGFAVRPMALQRPVWNGCHPVPPYVARSFRTVHMYGSLTTPVDHMFPGHLNVDTGVQVEYVIRDERDPWVVARLGNERGCESSRISLF